MNASPAHGRVPSKAEPKAKGKPRARKAAGSRPRKAATKPKSAPKPRAKPKPRASEDWREATLVRMRGLILEADPEMIEERKWRKPSNAMEGIPVWSHDGIVCTGETYTKAVKLTFAHGANVPDPTRLFNTSLEGHTRRAIDIHEGDKIDASAFKALVKAAVALNESRAKER